MTTPNWIYLERIAHLKQQLAQSKPDSQRAENPLALPAKPAPQLWQFEVTSAFREHRPIDRAKLYEDVWSTPLTSLTERYGYSDVGLRKVCVALEVPLPGVGHWAKVAAGQSIPRPPLPEQRGREQRYFRDPRLLNVNSEETRAADLEWLAEMERSERDLASQPLAPVELPQVISKIDASVKKAIKKAEASLDGLKASDAKKRKPKTGSGRWEPSFDGWEWQRAAISMYSLADHDKAAMRVSTSGGEAAVELMSALAAGVIRRGGTVKADTSSSSIGVELANQHFTVTLKESFVESKLRRVSPKR